MKNKGFTLVELLAILGILAVITLITIPAVDGIIKKNKQKMYEQQIETIRNGLKTWGDANVDLLPEYSGDILIINLGYLKKEGFVQPDMVNVLDKQCFPNDMSVSIKKVNENYEYIVDVGSGSVPTVRDCSPGVLLYRDNALKGADPVLDDGLIPIYFEGSSVKVAGLDQEWYSYDDRLWANAVSVTSSTRNTYLNAAHGTTINESDILAYFVWVPRYKYRISTSGTATPSEIDIAFETKQEKESKGDAQTEYRTHPAFKFGSQKLNGIWVSKFETTGTASLPTSKPNQTVLNGQNAYTQFTQSLNFKSNTYGITKDTHMIKPSEYGAITYLSHSKYGINNAIRINNNSNGITGCGASSDGAAESTSCEIAFGDSSLNYPQSSTGNIYGIFDLAGGQDDRVMGIYKGRFTENSGFTSLPDSKYYDIISSGTYSKGCKGTICYGYALTETLGWYDSVTECGVGTSDPFLTMGEDYSEAAQATTFTSSCSSGRANNDSYRVIIAAG